MVHVNCDYHLSTIKGYHMEILCQLITYLVLFASFRHDI